MDTFTLRKSFATKNVGQRFQISRMCVNSPSILLAGMASWQQNFTKPGCALEFFMNSSLGSHWQLSRVCMQDKIYLPAWIRLVIIILIKSLWPFSLFSIKLNLTISLRQKACFQESIIHVFHSVILGKGSPFPMYVHFNPLLQTLDERISFWW